jgi:hypothetical protein
MAHGMGVTGGSMGTSSMNGDCLFPSQNLGRYLWNTVGAYIYIFIYIYAYIKRSAKGIER